MIRYAEDYRPSNSGSSKHVLYAPKVMENGSVELVESCVEDTDLYIDSFLESTDIRLIMAQLKAGDMSALNKRPGSFGDFTKAPATFAEALQLQIDSNRLFSSLPKEIKQKFDNNPSKFFATAGTDSWFESISPVLPDEVKQSIKMPVESVSEPIVKESSNES